MLHTLPDPRSFDAILFDMDGTLVDSEPIWFRVMCRVMPEHGGALPASAHGELHGLDRHASTHLLQTRFGLSGDPDVFWRHVVEALTAELLGVAAMPGAAAWVEAAAAAGQPRAVVSNSPHAMIDASLAGHPWGEHLKVRVSVEDVAQGKPAPDSYLLAAARLGVDAAACLVLEDSEAGARAAREAGATCLFITNGVVPEARAREITPFVVQTLSSIE